MLWGTHLHPPPRDKLVLPQRHYPLVLEGCGQVKDLFTRRMIALTIPLTFALVLIGAGIRDRVLDPVVSGGLIAILGAIVALFAGKTEDKDKDEDKKK